MDYASRWARFFAAVIDFIVLVVVWAVLGAVGILGAERDASEPAGAISALSRDTMIVIATALLYYAAMTVALGATLGKMALGMRVVGADGEKASVGAILVREIIIRWGVVIAAFVLAFVLGGALGDAGRIIAGLTSVLVGLIIVLRILVDDRRQGWHDKIGGTFVVKAR